MFNFSEAFKNRMNQLNINASELSKKINVSAQHVGDLLNSKRRWNETHINSFCEALDLQIAIIPNYIPISEILQAISKYNNQIPNNTK